MKYHSLRWEFLREGSGIACLSCGIIEARHERDQAHQHTNWTHSPRRRVRLVGFSGGLPVGLSTYGLLHNAYIEEVVVSGKDGTLESFEYSTSSENGVTVCLPI